MAYNNGFPVGYNYYPPMQNNAYATPQSVGTTQPTQNTSVIWVQGEAAAKSYLVAPNNTVQLWDSESPVIYLKSADASGMPSMRIIDYTIRDNTKTVSADYATKKDLEELRAELKALLKGDKDV